MEKYLIKPGTDVNLEDWDANEERLHPGTKKQGKNKLEDKNSRLEELQELMYAERKHRLLVILQGMDTSGKDGVIRHVFDGVNPQGVRVASFKVPTPIELDHDYLWRVHSQTPGKGEIVIFNRSHYEDVLVVRVHNLVDEAVWSRRYDHINAFEKMLTDEGTTIIKFFLHIDKDEQKQRLEERLKDPAKHWKFNTGDLKERMKWDDYTRAYEAVLSKTSTEYAPWHIIPANKKWYRNLVISDVLIETLEGFKMAFPTADEPLDGIVVE